jgi:anti-sigma regulatory factor (Ser/Thr protein kinase)
MTIKQMCPGPEKCTSTLTGDRVRLSVPVARVYLPLVLAVAEETAGLAGLEEQAKGRVRLIAEEIFLHIAAQCELTSLREPCQIEMSVLADGLELCFNTRHLAYDPTQEPDYSLDAVLEDREVDGLGLHLVKAYAQSITLTQKGSERRLCLFLTNQAARTSQRPWARMVPSLRAGLKLRPIQHEGRLQHKLEDRTTGKSFIVRALAHQVLSIMDGKRSFAAIMAAALKVMPEKGAAAVEALFEVLMGRGLVEVKELPRPQAEVEVRTQIEAGTARALESYQKQAEPKKD